MRLLFLIITSFILILNSLHLNFEQKNLIKKILINTKVTDTQKNYIHKILYKSYEKFAVKKAFEFKNLHKYKCRNIRFDELALYAKSGLWKSILNYKGYTSLDKFSFIYIKHELNQFLNDKYCLSSVSEKVRSKNKNNMTKLERNNYNYLLNINTKSYYWQFDKINCKNNFNQNIIIKNIIFEEYYKNFWYFINETNLLDTNSKIILGLKYNFYLKKIKSNREIGIIMNYSEEYVRKKHINSLFIIKNILHEIK
jgi:hypothetical protein